MRSDSEVHEVFRLAEMGLPRAEIARRIGMSRATVRDWLDHGEEVVLNRPMRSASSRRNNCSERCDETLHLDASSYAYLLGQYLGDGCISTTRGKHRLRIACCTAYPDIMAECVAAIRSVRGDGQVGKIVRIGCTEVYSNWRHWTCLFPLHGAGVKHLRPIVLVPWQSELALDRFPDRFIRGLIHSDGCRAMNKVRGANGRPYAYPRYFFSNRSDDIRGLFAEACEQLGVKWRRMNRYNISVARRESVELLDAIVGPKS
jgi:hypothetical protein